MASQSVNFISCQYTWSFACKYLDSANGTDLEYKFIVLYKMFTFYADTYGC